MVCPLSLGFAGGGGDDGLVLGRAAPTSLSHEQTEITPTKSFEAGPGRRGLDPERLGKVGRRFAPNHQQYRNQSIRTLSAAGPVAVLGLKSGLRRSVLL